MSWEVEFKFPVPDLAATRSRLERLGGRVEGPEEQVDAYYAHPCRDFAQTDEAVRIRQAGGRCQVTYKGPRRSGPAKTRREIELDVPSPRQAAELLDALGFRPVAEVHKRRCKVRLMLDQQPVDATLDDVRGLGYFVELELVTDEHSIETAQRRLQWLADQLGLVQPERRSYLELLLERTC